MELRAKASVRVEHPRELLWLRTTDAMGNQKSADLSRGCFLLKHEIESFCRFFSTESFAGVFSAANFAEVTLEPFFAGDFGVSQRLDLKINKVFCSDDLRGCCRCYKSRSDLGIS
jgi:hypothetical protein